MTPDTIITSEILAGLTKCPFCGAERTGGTKEGWRFDCGTFQILGRKQSEYRVARCIEISEATLRARVKELEEALSFVVPVCDRLHHPKRHQHNAKDECPVEAIIRKAKGTKP